MEWRKGTETLRDGDRYTLKQDGALCELQIRSLVIADAGEYLCMCGQEKTSATLTIKGKDHVCSCVRMPLYMGGSVPEQLPRAVPDCLSICLIFIPLANVSRICVGPTLDVRKQRRIGCFLT